jgi:hypothetical protein
MINLSKILFHSGLSGLANTDSVSTSFIIPTQVIATGTYVVYGTSVGLIRQDDIGQIQVNYQGVENVWRPICGMETTDFTTYELETLTYYNNGQMYITTYAVNETGGNVTLPNIQVNVRVFLYLAPF